MVIRHIQYFSGLPNVAAEWLALLLRFKRSWVQISAQRPTIPTEDFLTSSVLSGKCRARTSELGHDHFQHMQDVQFDSLTGSCSSPCLYNRKPSNQSAALKQGLQIPCPSPMKTRKDSEVFRPTSE
jgi:hypothetical protein